MNNPLIFPVMILIGLGIFGGFLLLLRETLDVKPMQEKLDEILRELRELKNEKQSSKSQQSHASSNEEACDQKE